jgi:hypothetical protein
MKTQVSANITIAGIKRLFVFTIDWDGLSKEDERALAQRSIIIAAQNAHRTANKGAGSWPTEAQCQLKATDWVIGVRTPVERDPVKIVDKGELDMAQLKELEAIVARKLAALKG